MSYPGVFVTKDIFDREMILFESRLRSFEKWRWGQVQDPVSLSICGFYYTGVADKVLCFHCGIGLHDWKKSDNCFLEHAIHSPLCPFLLLNKHKSVLTSNAEDPFDRLIVRKHMEL